MTTDEPRQDMTDSCQPTVAVVVAMVVIMAVAVAVIVLQLVCHRWERYGTFFVAAFWQVRSQRSSKRDAQATASRRPDIGMSAHGQRQPPTVRVLPNPWVTSSQWSRELPAHRLRVTFEPRRLPAKCSTST